MVKIRSQEPEVRSQNAPGGAGRRNVKEMKMEQSKRERGSHPDFWLLASGSW
jgi:hypothetical protein